MTTIERIRKPIRTYHPRRGRLSGRHFDALDRLATRYAFAAGDPVDVLEIGSGMGEATARDGRRRPGRRYLAVEIHTPGVANLLACIERAGPDQRDGWSSVRRPRAVPRADPRRVLDAVHVFFPDPWPKARHHKRRLIQPDHVALLSAKLRAGGLLHCATDDARLRRGDAGDAHRASRRCATGSTASRRGPRSRPVTKFEQRALAAGRTPVDLMFVKS